MRNSAIEPRIPAQALIAAICRCQGSCVCGPDYAYEAASANKRLSEYEKAFGPIEKAKAKLAQEQSSFDPKQFEVIDAVETSNGHLVLKIKYNTCQHRAFEGVRVMVYLNTRLIDAIKWRTIDPHFNKPDNPKGNAEVLRLANTAPSPDARFPATNAGWAHALTWANSLEKQR